MTDSIVMRVMKLYEERKSLIYDWNKCRDQKRYREIQDELLNIDLRWEEAEKGHKRAVKWVLNGCKEENDNDES